VVTDNIGGVFWLVGDAGNSCYGYYYHTIFYLDADYSCGSTQQWINLFKTDVNGAVQYAIGFSSGIAQSFSIDNTGLLTIAGDVGSGVTLHGSTALAGGYSGFIDQQLLDYNCSCSNLATLVQEMATLLNITTGSA